MLVSTKRISLAAVVALACLVHHDAEAFLPQPSLVSSSRAMRRFNLELASNTNQASSDAAETLPTSSSVLPSLIYTHLEVNSMVWQIPLREQEDQEDEQHKNLSLLIDPIATQLDFGIAPLYRANKKNLSTDETFRLIQQAAPTHVLLSQGLDDHTHLPTIRQLVQRWPHLHYIMPPSAYDKVLGVIPQDCITVLNHGETYRFHDQQASVTATVGSLVGPPWQARENGYLLEVRRQTKQQQQPEKLSIYYEPHGDTEPHMLTLGNKQPIRADVCILPVTKQSLPAQLPSFAQFPLVHGSERMQEIVHAIGAKTVVPLCNGDLNTEGALSKLVASSGSIDKFQAALERQGRNVKIERPVPGEPLTVNLAE